SEGGANTLQAITAARRSACRTVYQSAGAQTGGTAKVQPPGGGWTIGDADCDGTAYKNCPPASCDADGDGFPNANTPAGNPNGLSIDCDDTDPTTFPGAPDKCGDAKAQNCIADTPCGTDADRDGYNATDDCDDGDANTHPWADERCDGKDNDCD